MKTKFKIGDWVKYTIEKDSLWYNKIGVITEFEGERTCIKFVDLINKRHSWKADNGSFKKVDENSLEIIKIKVEQMYNEIIV